VKSKAMNATAALRTAPQPGFWEDPKRMRPLGTQRPERPKSELWLNKYEKCGRCKARNAAFASCARSQLIYIKCLECVVGAKLVMKV
jgi:hypothetical protein